MRGEISGGRHVPPNVRVLSLSKNPAQEWEDSRKEILDRLKAENTALLKRLKDLHENGIRLGGANGEEEGDMDVSKDQIITIAPKESWDSLNKEVEQLKDIVAQKEKRLLRLQEVCSTVIKKVSNIHLFCCISGVHSEKSRIP